MHKSTAIKIKGEKKGYRLESRILEEQIQEAIKGGARNLEVTACGQHGIGGRLWISRSEPVQIRVKGSPGQRLGAMGFPGTTLITTGPASDDTGWLNAGAEIVIQGSAGNGTCNAMAQGKVMVAGSIGARGMTMTKSNPRLDPPELWVLGSVGDFFAEFMAGGTAVVCGVDPARADNILGYRPCVGMVGGRIFFRGTHKGYSLADAKLVEIDDESWAWLSENIAAFLKKIGKSKDLKKISRREDWQLLTARSPFERASYKRPSMADFRVKVWDAELGQGGLVGDLTTLDRSPVPVITTGDLRRFVPVWENEKYAAPCHNACPSGIPVRKRWSLIRNQKITEAVNLALHYTPFPGTICGHLCPNLCMESCTRGIKTMAPVEAKGLGVAGLQAKDPALPPLSGHRVAVVGGGPAGISVAWQLRMLGHEPVIFDRNKTLGGKISSQIPEGRIPQEVLDTELERVGRLLPHVELDKNLERADFKKLKEDFDFIVLATGSQKPRLLPVKGKELLVPSGDFLRRAKAGKLNPGKRVVIIGAGNVGCDVAGEAGRLGATQITLLDVQAPASFGKEREEAERYGAVFRWPCFTKSISKKGVTLADGEFLEADTVVISIGDVPDLDFLPDNIATEQGYVAVNDVMQTTDPQVFAIGDVVRLGLLTQAIGDGRGCALAIDAILKGERPLGDRADRAEAMGASGLIYADDEGRLSETIDYSRITLEYFDPRKENFGDIKDCADQCLSCGACRDCGVCEVICPQGAINRVTEGDGFKMVCAAHLCIGCGFCADACPCGIWNIVPS